MKLFYEAPKADEIRFATEDILDGSSTGNPAATEQTGGGKTTQIGDNVSLW